MTKIDLITGFLGSGKTTFMKLYASHFLSKGENIRLVCRRNGLERAWFIGDTVSDAAAAAEAGLPFIFAAYGFGAVPEAAYRIEMIGDLPALLAAIERREEA